MESGDRDNKNVSLHGSIVVELFNNQNVHCKMCPTTIEWGGWRFISSSSSSPS